MNSKSFDRIDQLLNHTYNCPNMIHYINVIFDKMLDYNHKIVLANNRMYSMLNSLDNYKLSYLMNNKLNLALYHNELYSYKVLLYSFSVVHTSKSMLTNRIYSDIDMTYSNIVNQHRYYIHTAKNKMNHRISSIHTNHHSNTFHLHNRMMSH